MKTQTHIIFTLGCASTYLAHTVCLPRLNACFLDILNLNSKFFRSLPHIDWNDFDSVW